VETEEVRQVMDRKQVAGLVGAIPVTNPDMRPHPEEGQVTRSECANTGKGKSIAIHPNRIRTNPFPISQVLAPQRLP